MAETLRRMGATVIREETAGLPSFSAAQGGFALQGRDEKGRLLSPERLLTLL